MEFLCQDLPQVGVVLVPPSSPAYDGLLADIRKRINPPVEGSPPYPEEFRPRISDADRATSAILLNQSHKAIAGLQAVWEFEKVAGRTYCHSRGMLSPQNVLLAYGIPPESVKLYRYWNTILPGSKRYVGESGLVGDNTDVRPPAADEKWGTGGMMGAGGGVGASRSGPEPVKRVTLVLDGVFFLDGEFAGPDREKMYEQTVAQAEARHLIGKIARDGYNKGLTPAQIFAEIDKVTGPPDESAAMLRKIRNADATPDDFRQWALRSLAAPRDYPQFQEDRALRTIIGWADLPLPNFRKR